MKHTAFFAGLFLPTVLLVVSGCSSADPSDADDTTTAQVSLGAGCQAYAEALVAKQAECPIEESDLSTGATVTDALARTCESLFGAPGSGATEANLRACATATAAASCTEFRGGLAECVAPFRGTLVKNEECLFDSQCGSGVCMGSTGSSCGQCVDRAGAGERCGIGASDVPCQDAFVCLATTTTSGTCETAATTNTKADVGSACETTCNNDWLVCQDGVCVERGGSCVKDNAYEVCAAGQHCDAKDYVSVGACVASEVVGAGNECGSSSGFSCAPGLYCDYMGGTICRSQVREGGTCSRTEDHCATGLACIAGECTVPAVDDYTCGATPKQDSPWK